MTTLDRDSVDTTQHEVSRLTVLDRAHVGDIEGAVVDVAAGPAEAGRPARRHASRHAGGAWIP